MWMLMGGDSVEHVEQQHDELAEDDKGFDLELALNEVLMADEDVAHLLAPAPPLGGELAAAAPRAPVAVLGVVKVGTV